MTKPGRRENTPSNEIARFTDREDQRGLFQFYLNSPTEPPVLMFYGIGGAGKTWLLKKLKQEMPADVPERRPGRHVHSSPPRTVGGPGPLAHLHQRGEVDDIGRAAA